MPLMTCVGRRSQLARLQLARPPAVSVRVRLACNQTQARPGPSRGTARQVSAISQSGLTASPALCFLRRVRSRKSQLAREIKLGVDGCGSAGLLPAHCTFLFSKLLSAINWKNEWLFNSLFCLHVMHVTCIWNARNLSHAARLGSGLSPAGLRSASSCSRLAWRVSVCIASDPGRPLRLSVAPARNATQMCITVQQLKKSNCEVACKAFSCNSPGNWINW